MGIKKIPFFDFSAVLDKLQAIADNVHPTASGTSITPTGMHIVTEDDVQGAISELDSAVDSVNASLTQKQDTISPIAPTSDNATFETGGYFLIGNLVILDVTFTVGSGGATTGLRLLKDLPSTTQNDKPIFGMMMGSVNNNMTSMRIYGGGLYSNTSIGAGRYHVYGMYVTSI